MTEISKDTLNKINTILAAKGKKLPKGKFTKISSKPVPIVPKKKPQVKSKPKKQFDYKMGEREGNTRIIGPDSVSISTADKVRTFLGKWNNTPTISTPQKIDRMLDTIDGHIDASAQGQRGDCYFLAEINAILNTKGGQEKIKQNLHHNNDGSITVVLPGACAIRSQYTREGKGNGCEVTGVYRITPEALEKAAGLAGKSYSSGDLEVIALEIAMETYRAEMVKTKQNLGISDTGNYTAESSASPANRDDYLASGWEYDAAYILTGQKSELYSASSEKRNRVKPYKDGQYGYITREQMEQQNSFAINSGLHSKGISEVSSVTRRDSDLSRMLDSYQGKEGQYAITFSVRVAQAGPDGSTVAGGGHALTVVKITPDVIYVANPWHPNKIEPIPRDEFEKMATSLTATKVTSKSVMPIPSKIIKPTKQTSQVLSDLIQQYSVSAHTQSHSSRVTPENIEKVLEYVNSGNSANISADKLTRILNGTLKNPTLSTEDKERIELILNQLTSGNATPLSDDEIAKVKEFFTAYNT
ncbi:MAG: hypothetical protein NC191_03570 [Muribaculaceae bacterium]|nr:hypothetical protein [Muribaculaceae bacterium]